ncbi:MAG TPA: hypothetical protein ENN67_03710 [Firmicutes bacterium]|nr:hypothetical protein [Bacillota bacterium]
MIPKNISTTSILVCIAFAMLVLLGCPATQPGNGTNGDSTDTVNEGRAVTPDTGGQTVTGEPIQNDESATDDETLDTEIPPSDALPIPVEPPVDPEEPSDGEQAPVDEIVLTMTVNGVTQPIDAGILVYDGDQVQCEFQIQSEVSELAYYHVSNTAPVSIPVEGNIIGKEATIPYIFTYVAATWGTDGAIIVTVTTKSNAIQTWEIPVIQEQMAGFHGN